MLLAQTLQELERGRYSVIGIIATNDYDRLFLASRVREFCPDARLSFTASTCLYTHHDMVPYLRGSLVASTYPLQLANQQWAPAPKTKDEDLKVLPRKVPPHVAFPHDNVEGIYNAVLANLSEMMNRRNPPLLDYSFPGEPLATKTVPPIWISVVGERGLYPLKVVPGDTPSRKDTGDENGGLYRLPEVGKPEQHRLTPRLDPNWVAVFLAVALAGAAGSLWYLWACLAPKAGTAAAEGWPGWLQVGPGLHESVNSPAGRRLAALATTSLLALVVLQGMPAWAFAALMVTSGGDVGLASDTVPVLLGGVVAFVAGVAASLVALVVLIMNYGSGPVKRGDRLSQLIVGLVALLQVAVLPICAAHALFQPREPATSLWTVESAGLRLDCERMSRLTAGVTPLLPLLLLSLAEAAAMAGGWRRLVLLARLLRGQGAGSGAPPGRHRSGRGPRPGALRPRGGPRPARRPAVDRGHHRPRGVPRAGGLDPGRSLRGRRPARLRRTTVAPVGVPAGLRPHADHGVAPAGRADRALAGDVAAAADDRGSADGPGVRPAAVAGGQPRRSRARAVESCACTGRHL